MPNRLLARSHHARASALSNRAMQAGKSASRANRTSWARQKNTGRVSAELKVTIKPMVNVVTARGSHKFARRTVAEFVEIVADLGGRHGVEDAGEATADDVVSEIIASVVAEDARAHDGLMHPP